MKKKELFVMESKILEIILKYKAIECKKIEWIGLNNWKIRTNIQESFNKQGEKSWILKRSKRRKQILKLG